VRSAKNLEEAQNSSGTDRYTVIAMYPVYLANRCKTLRALQRVTKNGTLATARNGKE
jgi:hypothetical protein